jgi:hypothetical protein
MATTALIAEFLISGLIIVTTIFFAILSILGVRDLKFLVEFKELSTVFILLISVFAYLMGALLHGILSPATITILLSRIRFKKSFDAGRWTKEDSDTFYWILQHGSEPLIDRIEYKQSMSRLLNAATLTLPLLGSSLTIWLTTGMGWKSGLVSAILFFLIWIASAVATIKVNRGFVYAIRKAGRAIEGKVAEPFP